MKSRILATALSLSMLSSPAAYAVSNNTWADISDVSVFALAGSALLVPVVRDDWEGARQAALSLGTAEGIALLGKATIHEQRPDQSDNNSFPSGHSALAFALVFSFINSMALSIVTSKGSSPFESEINCVPNFT